jgi:hypothetical protein
MKEERITLKTAFDIVKACRQCIRPNDSFIDQLSDLELAVVGHRATNAELLYHL